MAKGKEATSVAATLLVELLTEELPPKSLLRLADTFRDVLASGLNGSSLAVFPYNARSFASPRRLAALIPNVSTKATDERSETSGPLVAAGTKAAEGFANKYGVAVDALRRVSTPKGEVYVASYTKKGVKLDDVLVQKVEAALRALPISKVMRWGAGHAQFARPVHGLVMMHGKRVISGTVLGTMSGSTTSGHRFMGAAQIRLSAADTYEDTLYKKGAVIADFGARRAEIDKQLRAEAKREGGNLGDCEELLDEVTALVELPTVYVCGFDPSFLDVPQECLILTMRQHQKYFPLFAPGGKLLPKFLVVSNMRVKDPRAIVSGNERVVRPRLEDARFFFNQDRKVRLETRVLQLANVVYHNKLGSQLERVERIQLLAGKIARDIEADPELARSAAWLSKADLLTGMVGEFPELQGIMGRYYAQHDGEPAQVADAIEQHYRPRFAGDLLPESPVAIAVALADKLYTIVGIFAAGGAPTGEKDPFGLRRQALGTLRILMEASLALDLFKLIRSAEEVFPKGLIKNDPNEVRGFILDRLRHYLREQGDDTLQVDAVVSQANGLIYQVPARLKAVKEFVKLPEARDLAIANKRVLNIINKNEEIRGRLVEPNRSLMKEPAEIALMEAVTRLAPTARKHFDSGEYEKSLLLLAKIKPDVDRFFDQVMVMVEDTQIRNNRAALLQQLGLFMNQVADISKLAVEK